MKCRGFIDVFSGRQLVFPSDKTFKLHFLRKTLLYMVKPGRQKCLHSWSSYQWNPWKCHNLYSLNKSLFLTTLGIGPYVAEHHLARGQRGGSLSWPIVLLLLFLTNTTLKTLVHQQYFSYCTEDGNKHHIKHTRWIKRNFLGCY